jgi:hypothetical protein
VIIEIILFVVVVLGLIGARLLYTNSQKSKRLLARDIRDSLGNKVDTSWATRDIVKRFRKLPEANQPMTEQTLINTLLALDTKFEIASVDSHFDDYYYEMRWSNCECRPTCRYHEYLEIRKAIDSIQYALEAREKELQLAGVANSLSAVSGITESLRGEAQVIADITKDLVS